MRELVAVALAASLLGAGCGDRAGGPASQGSPPSAAPSGAASAPPSPPTAPEGSALLPGGPAPARPMSFAALVDRADASVATVKAVAKRGDQVVGEGIGTAFVYDEKGLLLTNHHVVDPDRGRTVEISVGFPSGVDLPATVVGSDEPTDVAVLKIEAPGLRALPLGDSDAIRIGEWVVAIGNPFGLTHTVSAGILSAKGRTRDEVVGLNPNGYFHFLQTDASINPGSSGGPLLDMEGRVVGINSAVRQNANGIGFAIPINMVKQLLPMLVGEGRVRRSALGVIVEELDGEIARRLGRPDRKGARIQGLRPGGPGDQAGLAVDDVILAFEGVPIEDPNTLRWNASIFGIGKPARVRVARGRREFDVTVQLGPLEQP